MANARRAADPLRWAEKLKADSDYRKKNLAARREYDRARDPIKRNAQASIRKRVARGKLKRGPCEVCGKALTDAHHDDYSKPADVRWLCRKHHKQLHERLRIAKAAL